MGLRGEGKEGEEGKEGVKVMEDVAAGNGN